MMLVVREVEMKVKELPGANMLMNIEILEWLVMYNIVFEMIPDCRGKILYDFKTALYW